ncbi:MAG: chorismate synthase [Candidatus Omnitrophota bacterium]|nr:chorismate synthase [Candidatus Omnitrophota bacterium]
MLRYLTSGESHGKCVLAILEGMPAGLKINVDKINLELKRRQKGYGRGPRMQIEPDRAEILSGTRRGITIGSPIALKIDNKDNSIEELPSVSCPRPGHADLAGCLKYGFDDIRNVLERASARDTASRSAIGAVCKIFLAEFDIEILSKVIMIGNETNSAKIKNKIDEAIKKKDTLGGIFELIAKNVPVGLGSYVQPHRRLDSKIAAGLISIPGIKAVEFGMGFACASKFGSEVHDAIFFSKQKGFFRKTNNAGGLEGGISNGEPLVVRCCMKPISTLLNPLPSVDILTKRETKATVERSDICVVEAAGVVAEAVLAFEITSAMLEKFGGDSLKEIKRNFQAFKSSAL